MSYSKEIKAMPSRASQSTQEPLFGGFPDVLTVQHIAEITGLSEQTIRKEMHCGHIPFVRIGHRLFCPKHKFAEYVEGEANET